MNTVIASIRSGAAWLSLAIVWTVAAVVLLLLTGPNLGRQPAAQAEPIAASVAAS
jgi:hypothetical protein